VTLWVIFVGLDAHEECPLFLRSLPNRCAAATDEKGHEPTLQRDHRLPSAVLRILRIACCRESNAPSVLIQRSNALSSLGGQSYHDQLQLVA
jgi:hypothetical protein